jgi:2-oxoglutarate ferredoxin oxidoreductase subunit beta
MPSIATGANMANRDMIYLGVSGDGDTASIGMGQFVHAVRRNLNMLYVVENNGCYGLTKGQDSATADIGSKTKGGAPNLYGPIDLVTMALDLGATFVARSFSGDKEQLVPLIKAALAHRGFAFIDVVSPCVTFNNTATSTKSYDFVREHIESTGKFDFVPMKEEITAEYEPGSAQEVTMHDGSVMRFLKLEQDFDPTDRSATHRALQAAREEGEILTGLLYIDPDSQDLHEVIQSSHKPLRSLTKAELCPGQKALDAINAGLR